MAGVRELRKRIGSARAAEQVTFALKLSAASRFRGARRAIENQRPYALKTLEVLNDVAARAPLDGEIHPLLASRKPKTAWMAVLASNQGLAGAFNVSVCRAAEREWRQLEESGTDVSFVVFGRKAREYFSRRSARIVHDLSAHFEKSGRQGSARFGRWVAAAFQSEVLDACYLVYNEYASVFCQHPRVRQLLPIPPVELDPTERTDFCYEPSKESLLSQLLPMYLAIESHRAVLESVASESAARMVAMDAAHKNSVKLLEELTLRYHRERQHGITSELIERTS